MQKHIYSRAHLPRQSLELLHELLHLRVLLRIHSLQPREVRAVLAIATLRAPVAAAVVTRAIGISVGLAPPAVVRFEISFAISFAALILTLMVSARELQSARGATLAGACRMWVNKIRKSDPVVTGIGEHSDGPKSCTSEHADARDHENGVYSAP